MKALSVRQPWAWAIIHAGKDVENRTWGTRYHGPLLIHASKNYDRDGKAFIQRELGIDVPTDGEVRRDHYVYYRPTSRGAGSSAGWSCSVVRTAGISSPRGSSAPWG